MKYFTNINSTTQIPFMNGVGDNQKIKLSALTRLVFSFFIILFSLFFFAPSEANAQCVGGSPSVLALWTFDQEAGNCNGANGLDPSMVSDFILASNMFKYCPNVNSGCGQALLGSIGENNSGSFSNALCVSGLGNLYTNLKYWDPYNPQNLYVYYTVPAGKSSCLTGFSIDLVADYAAMGGFGVTVYRNNVAVTTQTVTSFPNPGNGSAYHVAISFPNDPNLCTDGSQAVTFQIYFGMYLKTFPGDIAGLGFDNIAISGTCTASPTASAAIAPTTCSPLGANNDGKITLSNFGATDHYDYSVGTTYTGGKTYSTATLVPAGGVIASNLSNPASPQVYTVRVFTAGGCTKDMQVTLEPVYCPIICNFPTATLTATDATCGTTAPNQDAKITVSGITGGDKVGISVGATYSGPLYAAATVASGSYTFTGLPNPVVNQVYTLRVFNGSDVCFKDYQATINEVSCGPCKKMYIEIVCADNIDPNSTPNNGVSTENDFATYEMCKGAQNIDLKLTKTVTPTVGTTCPVNTDFVWTVTITNAGNMTATDIQVADYLPVSLVNTASSASAGTFSKATGWLIPSLAAGASATLTLTTQATIAGTFQNCAEIRTALPLNDPNSTPGNGVMTEDDYACASITVTGAKTPTITKEFNPWHAVPNTPFRLVIKINNNEATPITTTAPLVDNLPNTPAQMVIAATPNLATSLTGVVATAGGTSITIPSGTVLLPGLNQLQVDVTVPAEGTYCNEILAGDLKTTSCNNVSGTKACIDIKNTNVMAPMISKAFSPQVFNTSGNSTLTIMVQNSNLTAYTLSQNFYDYLPSGLVLSGAVSGTCPGVSTFGSTNKVGITSGAVIPAGSCTIVVGVTSTTAGTYCNQIQTNSMIGSVGGMVNVGNSGLTQACVTVNSTPCTPLGTMSISQSPTGNISPNGTATFAATATGTGANTVYNWTSTGGTFSNQTANPTFTAPVTAGTYTIIVTANNNLTGYGTCTATASTTVTVVTPPTPCTPITALMATANPGSVVAGGTVNITATPTPSATTYVWTVPPGAGKFSSTSVQNPVLTAPTTAGTYTYTVVASNTDGTGTCTKTATVTVTVTGCGAPTSVLASVYATTCNGSTPNSDGKITLSGFTAGQRYQYSVGSTFVSGSAIPASITTIPVNGIIVSNLANPATSQTYTIRVYDATDNTCYADSQVTLMNINCQTPCPTPNCNFQITGQKN